MIKKAVIPAAGNATRLRPLTNNCHKTMLPVGNSTMMKLILENLEQIGIEELIVITGFMSEELQTYVENNCGNIRPFFIHNPDYQTTNNAYSLYLSKKYIMGKPFILLDSDIIFEPETLNRVVKSDFMNVLALQKRDDLGEEEMKVYTENGSKIKMISKEGDPAESVGESIGIEKFSEKFSNSLFETLEKRILFGRGRTEYYEHAFQEMIENGKDINIVDVSDTKVMEVDFLEDLKKAEKFILPYINTGYN